MICFRSQAKPNIDNSDLVTMTSKRGRRHTENSDPVTRHPNEQLGGTLTVVSRCLEPSQPQRITSGLENELQPISKLFIPQVITPQVSFSQTTTQIQSTISKSKPRKTITHVLGVIYILRSPNMGTCIQPSDLFYCASQHKIRC